MTTSTEMIKDLYTTTATSAGGREGRVRTDDGVLDLELHAPEALGGPGGATNPEQLLAAGIATCYHSALTLVASEEGVDTGDTQVHTTVTLGSADDGSYVIRVSLEVELPGLHGEQAERLAERARQACPYTRSAVEVTVGVRES